MLHRALHQIKLGWNLDLPFIRSVILGKSHKLSGSPSLFIKVKAILVSVSWNSCGDYIRQLGFLTIPYPLNSPLGLTAIETAL